MQQQSSQKPVSQFLREAEQLGDEEFPLLGEQWRVAKRAIIRWYIHRKEPYGKGEANALRWFDEQYANHQRMSENSAVAEAMALFDSGNQQLLQMGDIQLKDGRYTATHKGVLRAVVLNGQSYLQTADEENRNLRPDEWASMLHLITLGIRTLEETA